MQFCPMRRGWVWGGGWLPEEVFLLPSQTVHRAEAQQQIRARVCSSWRHHHMTTFLALPSSPQMTSDAEFLSLWFETPWKSYDVTVMALSYPQVDGGLQSAMELASQLNKGGLVDYMNRIEAIRQKIRKWTADVIRPNRCLLVSQMGI